MACYERITESESAAEAPTCRVCGGRAWLSREAKQSADDTWICAACEGEEQEPEEC